MITGGKRREREDNTACNPFTNSVGTQVTSRRKGHASKAAKRGDDLTLDRQIVFSMKAEFRAKWLTNVLEMVARKELVTSDVYDIIASNRFVDGITPKIGRKMAKLLQEKLSLFSPKQKRKLAAEAALISKFGEVDATPEGEPQSDEGADHANDMLARCAAFVREKLVERGELADAGGEATANDQPARNQKGDTKHRSSSSSSESSSAPTKQAPQKKEDSRKQRKQSATDSKKRKRSKQSSSSSDSSAKKHHSTKVIAKQALKNKTGKAKPKDEARDTSSSSTSSTASSVPSPKKKHARKSSKSKGKKRKSKASSASSKLRKAKVQKNNAKKRKPPSSSSSSKSS